MPLQTRRKVLKGTAAASFWAANSARLRAAFPQPAVIKPELTPQAFGATGGDAKADTLGWNRAVAEGAASKRPVVGQGTYVLQVPKVSKWNWANRPSAPTRVAVELRTNTQIFGKDAEFILAPPVAAPSKDERHFIFGTNLNARPGSLQNIRLEGISFDFRDELGPIHPYTYAVGVTGVDNLIRHNLRIRSTGARAGRGLLAENIRGRSDTDLTHKNIVQGIYTRYERGVAMQHISFDSFSEALDFDGPCWDVTLKNMSFRNGHGEAQCIDTGGGANWAISDVTAENVASILFIYVKPNSWPTYAEFLAHGSQPTPTCIIPEKMSAHRVVGRNAGRPGRHPEVLRIGNHRSSRWAWPEVSPPRTIAIEDWRLEGGYHVMVNECLDLRMQHLFFSDTDTPIDKRTGAALALRQGKADRGSWISGTVNDVRIHDSKGMGLSALAGPDLKIGDVVVDGYNTRGAPATNAGVRIRGSGAASPPRLHDIHVVHSTTGGIDMDVRPEQ